MNLHHHGSSIIVWSRNYDLNINGFNTARKSIQARHNYKVTLDLDPGTALVSRINVYYDVNHK
jgi:hypothetical protein